MMTVVHLGASMAWFGMQQILSWGLIIDHYRSELNNSAVKRGVCFDTCAHLDRSRRLWPPRAPQGFTWRMLFSISVYSIHLSNCFIFTSYSLLKFSSTNKYCGYRTPFPKGKLYTLRTFKSFFFDWTQYSQIHPVQPPCVLQHIQALTKLCNNLLFLYTQETIFFGYSSII